MIRLEVHPELRRDVERLVEQPRRLGRDAALLLAVLVDPLERDPSFAARVVWDIFSGSRNSLSKIRPGWAVTRSTVNMVVRLRVEIAELA